MNNNKKSYDHPSVTHPDTQQHVFGQQGSLMAHSTPLICGRPTPNKRPSQVGNEINENIAMFSVMCCAIDSVHISQVDLLSLYQTKESLINNYTMQRNVIYRKREWRKCNAKKTKGKIREKEGMRRISILIKHQEHKHARAHTCPHTPTRAHKQTHPTHTQTYTITHTRTHTKRKSITPCIFSN